MTGRIITAWTALLGVYACIIGALVAAAHDMAISAGILCIGGMGLALTADHLFARIRERVEWSEYLREV